ncbi:unnamed protein product [Withania somnifera]
MTCTLLFLLLSSLAFSNAQLTFDYYAKTCPQFDTIVRDISHQKQMETPVTAAAMLRVFFHDCAVDGCDASILLRPTAFNKSELDYDINHSLAGDAFDLMHRLKTALELACPGVVSCAYILTMATRDLIVITGGPHYKVKLGRKDSLVSNISNVEAHLMRSNASVDLMIKKFQGMGFDIKDMVVLVGGGHTIGFVHCKEFAHRIFPIPDPTMNPILVDRLKTMCANFTSNKDMSAFLDVMSPGNFDNVLFKNLARGLAVLGSDQLLFSDPRTKPFVELYAKEALAFANDFGRAMEKVSVHQVKVGNQGEVRKRCDLINNAHV